MGRMAAHWQAARDSPPSPCDLTLGQQVPCPTTVTTRDAQELVGGEPLELGKLVVAAGIVERRQGKVVQGGDRVQREGGQPLVVAPADVGGVLHGSPREASRAGATSFLRPPRAHRPRARPAWVTGVAPPWWRGVLGSGGGPLSRGEAAQRRQPARRRSALPAGSAGPAAPALLRVRPAAAGRAGSSVPSSSSTRSTRRTVTEG